MENEKAEKDFIFISDEEGNEEKFEIIYEFENDSKNYMLVIPADSNQEEEEVEVLAFRYQETEDGVQLETIEEEAEWDMVEEVFNTLNEELAE